MLIPASVRSVGEGSFEYAVCRLSHVGAIVHVSADQLLTCFLTDASDGVPFDFGRYDELLRSGKNLPDRLGALLHRLAVPYRLADDMRSVLVSHLRGYGREAQERIAREGDRNMVEALVKAGLSTMPRSIGRSSFCALATAPTAWRTSWSIIAPRPSRRARRSGSRCEPRRVTRVGKAWTLR